MTRAKVLYAALVVLVAGYVAAAASQGKLPSTTDSPDTVAAWFVRHGDDVRLATWFTVLALAGLLTAVGLVSRHLHGSVRSVFVVGGIVTGTATMLSGWFLAGLSLHPAAMDPRTARTLLDVVSYYGPLVTAATMVMIAATGVAAWLGQLPKWLGAVAAVVFAEQAVETVTVFGKSGFTEPGGTMNSQLGPVLFLVWFVATGIAVTRSELTTPIAANDR